MSTTTLPPPQQPQTFSPVSAPEQAPKENWRKHYPGLARFLRNRLAVASVFVILLILAFAVLGPLLYTFSPSHINKELIGIPQQPSWEYPAGTDGQGRDLMARLMAGARISLAVGFVSCLINLLIGVGFGIIAGWGYASGRSSGKVIDTLLMGIVDILYSIPFLLVVVLLQIFVKPVLEATLASGGWDRTNLPLLLSPDLISIYLALGLTNWLTMARLTRGEVINQARLDYVLAAKSLGQHSTWILLKHILPNCVGPLTVAATLAIPQAIFVESFLAYIGLGVSAPQASWGTMAADGLGYLASSPHQLLFPAIAISLTMLAFNLFGDGLRDALDPSSR